MLSILSNGLKGRLGPSTIVTPFIAMFCLSPTLADDAATIWSINAANGRLSIADFDAGTTTAVNDDSNRLTSPRALAHRNDGGSGQVIVADTLGGSVLIYVGGVGSAETIINESISGIPMRPDGVDVDSFGNLFFVSSSPGESLPAQVLALERDSLCPDPFRPECLDGGYKLPLRVLDPEMVVDGIEVRRLSESRLAREANGLIQPGDLLVLAREPALLLLYRRQSATDPDIQEILAGTATEMDPDVLIPTAAFEGAVPTGMAFDPDGNLLISTSGGNILRFAPDGTRLMPDFANNLGNGKFKIEVAPDDGVFYAFVANRNGGELQRFMIEADGTGTLDSTITNGVQFPEDIVASTYNTVLAPAGSNIVLEPSSVLQSIVEELVAAGATSASAFALADIADTIPGVGRLLSDLDPSLPDILIPSNIRALDNSVGDPIFVYVSVVADFSVFGIIQFLGDGEQVLGVDYLCDNADHTMVPQMSRAPGPGDTVGPEGISFSNISNGCGSSRGSGAEHSHFLLDHYDMETPVEIATFQFGNLNHVMQDASSCVAANVFKKLDRKLTSAERNFGRGRLSRARNDILAYEGIAAVSPNAFVDCDGDDANMFGNLRSRALAIAYQLSRALQ